MEVCNFFLKYQLKQVGFCDQNSGVLEEFQKPSASLTNLQLKQIKQRLLIVLFSGQNCIENSNIYWASLIQHSLF